MDLTRRLQGHVVSGVLTDGQQLLIVCRDGYELVVQWLDESGAPVKGRPVVKFAGINIRARGQDVEHVAIARPAV